MRLNAGETVAIVGHNGSGKSTIFNLIQRFYDIGNGQVCLQLSVTEGAVLCNVFAYQVLVNGRNVNEWNVRALRREIGVVRQEPYLFSGTIAENILVGAANASMEDVKWAAKQANAHEFIELLPGVRKFAFKMEVVTV